MPFTYALVITFFKVILHIIIIVVAFSSVFKFLLPTTPGFDTFSQSFVKTLVWMLGDLAYDDTFLNPDIPLHYSILSNVLFIVFVTTIAGFIFNMIMMHSSDQLVRYQKLAKIHYADACLRMQLLVDDVIPQQRRKHATNQRVVQLNAFNEQVNSDVGKMFSTAPDKYTDDNTATKQNDKERIDMQEKFELLIEEVSEINEKLSNLCSKKHSFDYQISDDSLGGNAAVVRSRGSTPYQRSML